MCPSLNAETPNGVLGPGLDNCDDILDAIPPTADDWTDHGALACDKGDDVIFTIIDLETHRDVDIS